MLKFYLSTVIIWMIIIYGLCFLFQSKIKEKGWIKEGSEVNKLKSLTTLIFMSAIPIFRILAAVSIILMAYKTEEELENMIGCDDDAEDN